MVWSVLASRQNRLASYDDLLQNSTLLQTKSKSLWNNLAERFTVLVRKSERILGKELKPTFSGRLTRPGGEWANLGLTYFLALDEPKKLKPT